MGFLGKDVSLREERIGDSFNKYFLRVYYAPGTVPAQLCTKQAKSLPHGAYILLQVRFWEVRIVPGLEK